MHPRQPPMATRSTWSTRISRRSLDALAAETGCRSTSSATRSVADAGWAAQLDRGPATARVLRRCARAPGSPSSVTERRNWSAAGGRRCRCRHGTFIAASSACPRELAATAPTPSGPPCGGGPHRPRELVAARVSRPRFAPRRSAGSPAGAADPRWLERSCLRGWRPRRWMHGSPTAASSDRRARSTQRTTRTPPNSWLPSRRSSPDRPDLIGHTPRHGHERHRVDRHRLPRRARSRAGLSASQRPGLSANDRRRHRRRASSAAGWSSAAGLRPASRGSSAALIFATLGAVPSCGIVLRAIEN